jgi:hypothetical protein
VADGAAVDIGLDRAKALLERRLRIHAVQVVETDRLGAQRPQALLDLGPQHLGAALAGTAVAALGGDEHVLGGAIERLADGALAVAAAVQVRGVDVAYAGGHGFADEGHVPGRSGEPVGAQADAGHVDAGESEVGHPV